MANADTPFGFKATGVMSGLQPFLTGTSSATAIFNGDLITALTAGTVHASAAGDISLLGAVAGGVTVTTNKNIIAASTAGTILAHWDPDQVYIAQAQTGDTVAQTDLFANADHVAGAGDTNTGISGHELDIGAISTTATGGFKLLDFVRRDDNDITAANAEYKCVINTGEGLLKLITGI